jgi:DNA-binding NtrC family response regulator
VPPLRERRRDIVPLAAHFLAIHNARHRRNVSLTADAIATLERHSWPGNVRELENAMHRAVLLSSGPEIEEMAIRLPDGQPLAAADPGSRAAQAAANAADAVNRAFVGQTVAAMEQTLIIDTLEHCLGNRTHAANILGISIRTLRNKLKEYSEAGVSVPAPQMGASAA